MTRLKSRSKPKFSCYLRSDGYAVRPLSGMFINTCYRPQTVFRLFSEAATREAVPLWNQTDDQFVQLGLTGI